MQKEAEGFWIIITFIPFKEWTMNIQYIENVRFIW